MDLRLHIGVHARKKSFLRHTLEMTPMIPKFTPPIWVAAEDGLWPSVVGPPHLCGGKSALALCERVSTPITRFSAGNANAPLGPARGNRRRERIGSLGP